MEDCKICGKKGESCNNQMRCPSYRFMLVIKGLPEVAVKGDQKSDKSELW